MECQLNCQQGSQASGMSVNTYQPLSGLYKKDYQAINQPGTHLNAFVQEVQQRELRSLFQVLREQISRLSSYLEIRLPSLLASVSSSEPGAPGLESARPESDSTRRTEARDTLIQIASDFIPQGYAMITSGQAGIGFALPSAEALQFSNFLNSTAGYFGGIAGQELAEGLGDLIGANGSQTAALGAVGASVGSAAASGAAAAAMTSGATAGGVGAAAASSAAAAWPVAVVIAAYSAFNNIRSMRSAVGGGPLTDQEIKVALDSFGIEHFVEKAMPAELSRFMPAELEYAIYPHRLMGQVLFGSAKHQDQIMRDRIRTHLEKLGMATTIDGSHHVKLADGSFYNIGLDGSTTIPNLAEGQRRPYNTDPTNPLVPQVVGWLNPLAVVLTGGEQKTMNDLSGYLVNAVLSNVETLEGAKQNIMAVLETSGLSPREMTGLLADLLSKQKITEAEYDAYLNGYASLLL